ncbi:MAG TPA: ATP-binding cassette domain-containing protein [Candidatus Ozemobacteraceae bacterium]|nr:ATP-binding cassette domain-containing protein [Candidatus Ozemobacteraceae bacterium]
MKYKIYLSYQGLLESSEFFKDFAPDEKFTYRREESKIPQRFIRAYKLRNPQSGEEGPWLAGMTLDPSVVYEAWCHQRGYVCMIEEFGGRYGLKIDPGARVSDLSAGEQQRVELLKALMSGAKWLVLDEPTSVLTPREADELFVLLKRMTGEGHGIIFISHKLDEVLAITDRVVVLRHGRPAGECRTKDADQASLARLMIGRQIDKPSISNLTVPGEAVLDVRRLSAAGSRGPLTVNDASFVVRGGEIIGIAGISGNGQRELLETIAGMRPATAGTVSLCGVDITDHDVRTRTAAGLAFVPEDRLHTGTVPSFSLTDNAILRDAHRDLFSRNGFLDTAKARERWRGSSPNTRWRLPAPTRRCETFRAAISRSSFSAASWTHRPSSCWRHIRRTAWISLRRPSSIASYSSEKPPAPRSSSCPKISTNSWPSPTKSA